MFLKYNSLNNMTGPLGQCQFRCLNLGERERERELQYEFNQIMYWLI